jgi:hypothetical protein
MPHDFLEEPMMRIRVASVLICAAATACGVPVDEPGNDLAAAEDALVGGLSGMPTGLTVRWRINGSSGCSGVMLPVGGTAEWVLTNEHCLGSAAYGSSSFDVVTGWNDVIDVTEVHTHPVAEWNLGHLPVPGTSLEYGKVDVVIAKLATPYATVLDDVLFSGSYAERDVKQESARKDGAWSFSWALGYQSPSSAYATRMASDVATEGGDSGGPVWRDGFVDGKWVLEGLHGSSSDDAAINHITAAKAWVNDVRNCGGFDMGNPNDEFCTTSCKCGPGEGDCDVDADCEAGLLCSANAGDKVGLPATYGICLEATRVASGTSGYCGAIGGCQIFEGDCNAHDECKGDLVCRPNVGAAIGLGAAVDVCDLPRQPGKKPFNNARENTTNYCTTTNPCSLGDGDCDSANHATCRGYLKCKTNVGNQYGFTDNDVDVCVHPDFY